MCGIVGYIGNKQAQETIISGLKRLEYRGYDSAGMAVIANNQLKNVKFQGKLAVLEDYLLKQPVEGHVGIGHTRWATHGKPSDINSHPHTNSDGSIAVVHNGIIENYLTLKKSLINKGYKFISETDTEVVAHLIDSLYKDDLLQAVFETVNQLKGSFALGIISEKDPQRLIAVRKESPLIVGVGTDEYFIASDVSAVLNYTKEVYFLDNLELADIKKNQLDIYDFAGNKLAKEKQIIEWTIDAADKNGFDHYMLKEIFEQPQAIKKTIEKNLDETGQFLSTIAINAMLKKLNAKSKIYIVACGTAYNAGKVGKIAIEALAKTPVEVDIASEFKYSNLFIDKNSLVILVSQSGETADTLAVLRDVKQKGAQVLAITNTIGSSIARESDATLFTCAGPEIAVASTKAYVAQITVLIMVALQLAQEKQTITHQEYDKILNELRILPAKIELLLNNSKLEEQIANQIKHQTSLFYIGRGGDYQTATEAALKLKEVSYVHTEALASGELKHGTIALIDEGTPVIALITQDNLVEKTISNIKEVKARGAYVIAITTEAHIELENVANKVIYIPQTIAILQPILSVIPTQLIAYYTARAKNLDVDKPRNLAKSVTVE